MKGGFNRCKRCGGLGHMAKKCNAEQLGRPDIERMRDRLKGNKGERATMQRAKALETFDALIEYIYKLEAHRSSLVGALRHYRLASPEAQ